MEWFRLWHDFFDDPKLKRLTKSQRYDIAHLLRIASGNAVRGQIDLDREDIAAQLELSDDECTALIEYLERKNIVQWTSSGSLLFVHWISRQPNSDNVSARVAAHRARKAVTVTETLPEQDVTLPPKDETLQKRYCNTQNRTEQNREYQSISEEIIEDASPGEPSMFLEFMSVYPKKSDRKGALIEWKRSCPNVQVAGKAIIGLKAQIAAGVFEVEDQFIPLARNYLKGERWKDELPKRNGRKPPGGHTIQSMKSEIHQQLIDQGVFKDGEY